MVRRRLGPFRRFDARRSLDDLRRLDVGSGSTSGSGPAAFTG